MNDDEIEIAYWKHFSRFHEQRAKISYKTLIQLNNLIDDNQVEEAITLLRDFFGGDD